METSKRLENTPKRKKGCSDEDLEQIKESLRGLQFGSLQIFVQDGVIVQIDRTEKRRVKRCDATRKE